MEEIEMETGRRLEVKLRIGDVSEIVTTQEGKELSDSET